MEAYKRSYSAGTSVLGIGSNELFQCLLCDFHTNSKDHRLGEQRLVEHLSLIHFRTMITKEVTERENGTKKTVYKGPRWLGNIA